MTQKKIYGRGRVGGKKQIGICNLLSELPFQWEMNQSQRNKDPADNCHFHRLVGAKGFLILRIKLECLDSFDGHRSLVLLFFFFFKLELV